MRTAVEGGINFYDTADVYNGGESEVITGRLLRNCSGYARSTSSRPRSTAARCPARTAGTVTQAHHGSSTPGCDGWSWTTSTCTRSIASIPNTPVGGDDGRPARRRHPGKVRYLGASSMFAWQFAKLQSVAHDAVRVDAEPLQPDLSRGGAGDDRAAAAGSTTYCSPTASCASSRICSIALAAATTAIPFSDVSRTILSAFGLPSAILSIRARFVCQ